MNNNYKNNMFLTLMLTQKILNEKLTPQEIKEYKDNINLQIENIQKGYISLYNEFINDEIMLDDIDCIMEDEREYSVGDGLNFIQIKESKLYNMILNILDAYSLVITNAKRNEIKKQFKIKFDKNYDMVTIDLLKSYNKSFPHKYEIVKFIYVGSGGKTFINHEKAISILNKMYLKRSPIFNKEETQEIIDIWES